LVGWLSVSSAMSNSMLKPITFFGGLCFFRRQGRIWPRPSVASATLDHTQFFYI